MRAKVDTGMVAGTAPPTLALPLKGGGDKYIAQNNTPSPLKGEGWGGGDSFTKLSVPEVSM